MEPKQSLPPPTTNAEDLEGRLKELEQDKRRSERLLFLTRKVVSPGPLKSGHRGRPPKVPSSTAAGPRPLPCSKSSAAKSAGAATDGPTTSMPTAAGGGERSSGNES